ncbi:MAG: sigma-54 interaction domain-containing protein, partial [bacterium]
MEVADQGSPLDKIISQSPLMKEVKRVIEQVAASDITVLITGESGTGKELVARAIHSLSPRRKGPLLTVNCGAIPEGIFESEIFGHEKGAFTTALERRRGYFEQADKGSIFLDEIGEMPLPVQVKLLRVLDMGTFMRVGGSGEIKVDVRIIAATNKDLGLEVARGRFRQDLFYRLKAVNIILPPLRDRPEDIPLLVEHFAQEFAQRNRHPLPKFEPEAMELLQKQHWAGNVRELKNFIESLLALSRNEVITEEEIWRLLPTLSYG